MTSVRGGVVVVATRRGVIAYVVLAFGLAWICWEVPIRLGVSVRNTLFQLALLPGAFAPAIAALLVRTRITREGFADAGLRIQRRHWRYWLFALLLPLAVVACITVEASALRIAQPDFTVISAIEGLSGRHVNRALPRNLGLLMIPQLLVTAVVATPILWGEEFGWRGYLQPRLFPGRPLPAAIATGVIWGLWHYPLILRGYDFGDQAKLGAGVFLVTTVLMSIIFGWLNDRTGSIWVPSLAHSATNAVGASLTVLWFYGAGVPVLTAYVGVLAWPALLIASIVILLFGYPRASGAAIATEFSVGRVE